VIGTTLRRPPECRRILRYCTRSGPQAKSIKRRVISCAAVFKPLGHSDFPSHRFGDFPTACCTWLRTPTNHSVNWSWRFGINTRKHHPMAASGPTLCPTCRWRGSGMSSSATRLPMTSPAPREESCQSWRLRPKSHCWKKGRTNGGRARNSDCDLSDEVRAGQIRSSVPSRITGCLNQSMGLPKVRCGCAPCKGGAFQWVQAPPGNRSSRKQSEQSWR